MSALTHFFHRSERPRKSLAALGGLARTFGSLACFLALTFLGLGAYILAGVFANPIAAQAVALVAAAFIIALASFLLFYLFKPRERFGGARIRHRKVRHASPRSYLESGPPREMHHSEVQLELPYQGLPEPQARGMVGK